MYKTIEWFWDTKKIALKEKNLPKQKMKVFITFVSEDDFNDDLPENYNYKLIEIDKSEVNEEMIKWRDKMYNADDSNFINI